MSYYVYPPCKTVQKKIVRKCCPTEAIVTPEIATAELPKKKDDQTLSGTQENYPIGDCNRLTNS